MKYHTDYPLNSDLTDYQAWREVAFAMYHAAREAQGWSAEPNYWPACLFWAECEQSHIEAERRRTF
jgi:hypothetical protein